MAVGSTIERLNVALGLDDSAFAKGLQTAQDKLRGTGKRLQSIGGAMSKTVTPAIAALGAAALGAAVKVGNMADQLLDLEQQTGLSTDSLQEFRRVADVAGVAQDTIAKAAEQLTLRLSRGAEGSADMRRALEELGISARDAEGNLRPMDQVVNEALSNLADMEDVTQRNVLATQLFSRSASDLAPILGLGSDEIARLREEAHSMGLVIGKDGLQSANNFRIAWDTLKTSLKAAAAEIGIALVPLMKRLVGILQDNIVPAVRTAVEWVKNLDQRFVEIAAIVAAVVAVIGPLVAVVGTLVTAFTVLNPVVLAIGAVIAGLATVAVLVVKNWDWLLLQTNRVWRAIKEVVFANIRSLLDGLATLTSFIPKVGDAVANARDRFNEFADGSVQKTSARIDELRQKLEENRIKMEEEAESANAAATAVTNVGNAAATTAMTVQEQLVPSINSLDGALAAFQPKVANSITTLAEMPPVSKSVTDAAEDAGKQVGEMGKLMESSVRSAGSAIGNWARNSGRNIRSFVKAAIVELGKLIAKMAIFKGIQAIFGAATGGVGGAAFGAIGSIFGFADGGFMQPGQVGLVGERGPEIIQAGPRGATITPTDQGMALSVDLSNLPPPPRAVTPDAIAVDAFWRQAFSNLAIDARDRGVSFA